MGKYDFVKSRLIKDSYESLPFFQTRLPLDFDKIYEASLLGLQGRERVLTAEEILTLYE